MNKFFVSHAIQGVQCPENAHSCFFFWGGGSLSRFSGDACKCGQGRGGEIVWHRSPKPVFVCALHGSVQLSHLIQHLDTEKHKHTKRGGVKLDVLGQLRWVWCCLEWKTEGCQNGVSEFSSGVSSGPLWQWEGFLEHLPLH